MNQNAEILQALINQDFGLETKDGSRWGKSEEHDSLVIDKEKGIFFFNSRNIVGDPLTYLTQIRQLSFEDARDYLRSFDYTGTHVYTVKSYGKDTVVYPELVNVFFDEGKEKREYFYKRGLNDSTINRFQLGWYNNYSMIPFFEGGSFRNFQMRKEIPEKRISNFYRNIGPLLFNSEVLKFVDTVYFVEGPIDAMILIQNGLPAVSTNTGGTFLPEWYSRFLKQKRIYLVFDNDKAGIEESTRYAHNLGLSRCKIYTFTEFEDKGYDPVDFFRDGNSVEDFIKIVEEKSKYAFEIPGTINTKSGRRFIQKQK
jgi:DNA primase